jgi:hypothetical protein
MDIKRKICDIRTWEKHLFLDISSTNIVTLVLSLYQCVEILSIENPLTVMSARSASLFQPLSHQPNVCSSVVSTFA